VTGQVAVAGACAFARPGPVGPPAEPDAEHGHTRTCRRAWDRQDLRARLRELFGPSEDNNVQAISGAVDVTSRPDFGARRAVTWVGLGGLEPPTSSLSRIIGHGRHLLRPRSAGRSVCPRVAVTIPDRPPHRARGGHDPCDLRITRVFRCITRGFKACTSFMFAGCCWWRSLAVDGCSGARS
jgi:hypothetical protein